MCTSRLLSRIAICLASLCCYYTLQGEEKHSNQPVAPGNTSEYIERICFGSCYKYQHNTQVFDRIAAEKPQLWIWMGDNVYGDTDNMEKLKLDYKQLNDVPEYQKLKQQAKVIATWDDHDYGFNDSGAEHTKKKESRDIALDAFDVPADAPVRKREGLYQSYTYGEEGKSVQVILLDTRYFRTKLMKKGKIYLPIRGEDSTILGEEQWKWLGEKLMEPADVRIIISSIQIVNSGHIFEKWANMPEERDRFFKLLKEKKVDKRTILLSGDRHFHEMSFYQPDKDTGIWEITSSGMSHGGGGWQDTNQWRVGERFASRAFGKLEINWTKKGPIIIATIIDNDGKPVQANTIYMNQ